MRVKITDKLEKLIEIVTEGNGGCLFVNGKAYNDLDQTVEKAELHDGQQVLVVGGAGGPNISTFLENPEFKTIVCLLEGRPKVELLYNGKDHEFEGRKFHEICDNQGPTMVVVKDTKDLIFGFYCPIDWTSQGGW